MRECGNLTTDRIKFDSTETILARSAAGLYRPATRRNSIAGDDRQASAQRIRPAPRAWGEASGSFPYLIALGLRPPIAARFREICERAALGVKNL